MLGFLGAGNEENGSQAKSTSSRVSSSLAAIALVSGGVALGVLSSKYLFKYKVPKVWTHVEQGGKFGKINQPTAGVRSNKDLPRGEHALQLYSLGTSNGQKVTMLMEELYERYGVEYDAWKIDIGACDQFTSGFVAANPNSKIPALIDYSDPNNPVRVFESASIMMYLCEKYDTKRQLLPPEGDPRRAECLSWLFWTQGSAPYLGGGFGHFYKYAPIKIEYAINRFSLEVKRQLDVIDRHLAGQMPHVAMKENKRTRKYLCGDEVTVADFCCYPWYGGLLAGRVYNAAQFLNTKQYTAAIAWADRMAQRPAVKRGACVNRTWGEGPQLKERHSMKDFEPLGLSRL